MFTCGLCDGVCVSAGDVHPPASETGSWSVDRSWSFGGSISIDDISSFSDSESSYSCEHWERGSDGSTDLPALAFMMFLILVIFIVGGASAMFWCVRRRVLACLNYLPI